MNKKKFNFFLDLRKLLKKIEFTKGKKGSDLINILKLYKFACPFFRAPFSKTPFFVVGHLNKMKREREG